MYAFASLLDSLSYTQSRNRKIALLARYFQSTPDPDRGWALAALTDGLPITFPMRRILTELMAERIDPELYRLSRDFVGDTAETVALLWRGSERDPDPDSQPSINDVVETFATAPKSSFAPLLADFLDRLDTTGRWALLKLLGGAPRVGVSARLAKTGLSEAFSQELATIEEVWHAVDPPYRELFDWLDGNADQPDIHARPVFRPLMLAHPIEPDDWQHMNAAEFAAEWKWDGIRVQVAAKNEDVRIYSRTGDDISRAFPDVSSAFLGRNCVVDGELLIVRDGLVAPFNDLQQRLNRKTVSARMLRESPAHVRLYDLLFAEGDDLRQHSWDLRRARLEDWYRKTEPPLTNLSEVLAFDNFESLRKIWQATRDDGIEGLMLKRRDSPYLAGRQKGHWWKWKRAPLTLDCVLMYAQRGSGKRSSFFSDYTFGVWREGKDGASELVPVGKAYSGFTDDELKELDKFVRNNTTDRFGPVRAVSPGLVLEVAFDAVHKSTRHKSGVAMRFPRIARIRWDKPADEADTLATVEKLLNGQSN